MKQIFYLFLALLLALIEINIKLKIFFSGFNLMAVSIIGFSLLFVKKNNVGLIILIAGSIILDIFSPFRFGLYTLTTLISIIILFKIQTKHNIIDNPLYLLLLFSFLSLFTHIFELFSSPIYGVFFTSIWLNSFIGAGMIYLLNRLLSRNKETIKVSENVHFR